MAPSANAVSRTARSRAVPQRVQADEGLGRVGGHGRHVIHAHRRERAPGRVPVGDVLPAQVAGAASRVADEAGDVGGDTQPGAPSGQRRRDLVVVHPQLHVGAHRPGPVDRIGGVDAERPTGEVLVAIGQVGEVAEELLARPSATYQVC